jgi:hypothetical protein
MNIPLIDNQMMCFFSIVISELLEIGLNFAVYANINSRENQVSIYFSLEEIIATVTNTIF